MTLQEFKLAVVSDDTFSDAEVEKLFYETEINTEEELREALDIIVRHRPKVAKTLETLISYFADAVIDGYDPTPIFKAIAKAIAASKP